MLRSEQKDGRVVFKGCFLFVGIFLKLYFPVGFPYIKHVHCVLMSYILKLFINTNKQIELWWQRSFTYSLTHNSAVWEQQFNSIQPTINILQVSALAISGLKYNERSTFLANALSYCQWLPIMSLLMPLVLLKLVVSLYLPLALQGAWGGRRGIVTVLLIAGEGLLGCGLGVRCLLPRCRAHLNTAS